MPTQQHGSGARLAAVRADPKCDMGPAGAGIHRASSSRLEAAPQSRLPFSRCGCVDMLMLRTTTTSSHGSAQLLGRQRQKNQFGAGVGLRYQIVQRLSSSRQYDFTRTETAADSHREQCKTFSLRCFLTPANLEPRLPSEGSYPPKPQFLRILLRICAVLDPACWTLISQKSLRSATLRCWPGLCACPPLQ